MSRENQSDSFLASSRPYCLQSSALTRMVFLTEATFDFPLKSSTNDCRYYLQIGFLFMNFVIFCLFPAIEYSYFRLLFSAEPDRCQQRQDWFLMQTSISLTASLQQVISGLQQMVAESSRSLLFAALGVQRLKMVPRKLACILPRKQSLCSWNWPRMRLRLQVEPQWKGIFLQESKYLPWLVVRSQSMYHSFWQPLLRRMVLSRTRSKAMGCSTNLQTSQMSQSEMDSLPLLRILGRFVLGNSSELQPFVPPLSIFQSPFMNLRYDVLADSLVRVSRLTELLFSKISRDENYSLEVLMVICGLASNSVLELSSGKTAQSQWPLGGQITRSLGLLAYLYLAGLGRVDSGISCLVYCCYSYSPACRWLNGIGCSGCGIVLLWLVSSGLANVSRLSYRENAYCGSGWCSCCFVTAFYLVGLMWMGVVANSVALCGCLLLATSTSQSCSSQFSISKTISTLSGFYLIGTSR